MRLANLLVGVEIVWCAELGPGEAGWAGTGSKRSHIIHPALPPHHLKMALHPLAVM